MCAGEGGAPLREGCACPARPPSPSSQKYSWAETRSPAVWPAQRSRLPDAWLLPHPHGLGVPPVTPGQDAKEAPEPRWPSHGIPVSWAQSLGLHSNPCPWSTPLPNHSCQVAQGLVQPSGDTLLCSASASGLNTRGLSVFPCGFVSQPHDALGLSLLDKTPAS